jgi:GNAT superfamily N-acetyltransferase
VNGTYLETDEGLPEARGQTYVLPAGGLFRHTGRPDHAGRDLLQPRRLDAAGLGMSLSFRDFTGAGDRAGGRRPRAPARDGVPRLALPLRRRRGVRAARYLARYAKGDSIVVAAYAARTMVGAATGMPLSDHADDFAAAFAGTDIDMKDVFYCAESVLLSEYRGQGAGHAFFDRREAHAARLGFTQGGLLRRRPARRSPRTARGLPPARRVLARAGLRAARRRGRAVRLARYRRGGGDAETPAILDEDLP